MKERKILERGFFILLADHRSDSSSDRKMLYNIVMRKSWLSRIKEWVERVLPMTLSGLVLLIIVAYLLFVVGRSVWVNYDSRSDIRAQKERIDNLTNEIEYLEFQIVYFQTQSFKEKEARAKLGYKAPGEKVLSLAVDNPEDKVADQALASEEIKVSNRTLWWQYFFGE